MKYHYKEIKMLSNKITSFHLIFIIGFVYLLSGCGTTNQEPEENAVVVAFSVSCDLLVCHMDVSETLSASDTLNSLLCDMGDGNQVNPINQLEIVYDYTYAAPGSYDITCTAMNTDGNQDSLTTAVNVDGILVNAGPDQTAVTEQIVTLDGSLSEDTTGNSQINYYRWTYLDNNLDRPAIGDSNTANTVNPTFVAPFSPQTLRIRLEVSVDNGVSFSGSSDVVDITVIQAGGTDL